MALTFDYATFTITIPQSDLTLVQGTLYEADTNQIRLDIAAEQASERGAWAPTAFTHNTEVTVAGTTFARLIEIISPWSLEFEDGTYSVRLAGSNNNYFDVENGILNQNMVQVISNNSAGLVVVSGGINSQQDVRDAMELESTSGQASIDTKLNNNFAVSAAGL